MAVDTQSATAENQRGDPHLRDGVKKGPDFDKLLFHDETN
jgi:hypothetical protein